jgi:hypothetical protein
MNDKLIKKPISLKVETWIVELEKKVGIARQDKWKRH